MAGPSGAIRAGRAFVEMFADPSALNRALAKAKASVIAFGKTMSKVGLTAAAAGGAVLAPLAKMFSQAVTEGADISQLARKYQMPVGALSELKNAFAEAGVSGQEFGATLDGLQGKIAAAASANDELIPGLQGLRGNMLIGMEPGRQLDAVFEAFQRISSVSDQINVARDLGMEKLLPYLRKGKAGLDELRAAAKKNNEGWSEEDAAAAKIVMDEFAATSRSVKATILEVGKALLPTGASFTSVGEAIRDNLTIVRDWIKDHKEIIVGVTAGAAALVAGGLAVASFGAAVAVVAPIIGGLVTAIVAVKAVILAIVSPIGAAVAAVLAIGVVLGYLAYQTEFVRDAIADLKNDFGQAAEFIKGVWGGIGNALKAGDWSLAFKIGVKGAEVAWKEFVLILTGGWVAFKNMFVDTWEDATGFIAKAFIAVAAVVEKIFTSIISSIVEKFNAVAKVVGYRGIDLTGLARSDAEIDREAKQIIAGIDDITAAEKKRRAEFRRGQLGEAKTARDIAKEELDRLKKQAEEAANAADQKPPVLNDVPDKPKPPSFSALSELAKGTFGGGAIAQSLGYGDNVGQRQLDAQTAIRDNTAQSNKLLADMYAKIGGKFT